jgi:methenyltetrahydromethanopterin cyclohydrolase
MLAFSSEICKAMARTNDAILYAGLVYYTVEYKNKKELKEIVEKTPSKTSKDYGKPFIEIFKEADYNFYKIDPNLFAPAIVIINNIKTGNMLESGEIKVEALIEIIRLSEHLMNFNCKLFCP